MFKKYMTAGIVGSALLATAAFAQSPSTSSTTSTAPAAAPATASDSSFNGNWRTSKIVGLNVYNEANESLGSISDLLTDQQGNIKAVVIGVGGFLGVGEHLIAVPYDKIKFVNEPVQTTAASAGAKPASSSGMTTGAATTSGSSSGAAATGGAGGSSMAASKPNPWYPDHAVMSGASKDQLKAMPEFKYST